MIRTAVFLLFAGSLLCCSTLSPARPADPPTKADPKEPEGFGGRTKAGKAKLLKEFGGSEEGEEAVMLGLAWLTQMQKKEGNWVYDGTYVNDQAAATGMAVLVFLGAGQSHKEGRYKQTVQAGIDWLVNAVNMNQGRDLGKLRTISSMYSQGIATLALCEAYGMTRDPKLKAPTQAAIDYIQKGQGPRGSWGYTAGTDNDTSILGWQIQALHAAKLSQDLVVDDRVIAKAIKFLDSVSADQNKAFYGYNTPVRAAVFQTDSPIIISCTPIGLLCRYYVDGWRSATPGFTVGAKAMLNAAVAKRPAGPISNIYYYYYATQVLRFQGGDEWRTWNEGPMGADGKRKGGMADWLLSQQSRTPRDRGSWSPEKDYARLNWGRLGETCMCLLTLEVYYRYTPEDQK